MEKTWHIDPNDHEDEENNFSPGHPKHVLNCLSVHEHANTAPSKGEDNNNKNLCFRDTLKNIGFVLVKEMLKRTKSFKNSMFQLLHNENYSNISAGAQFPLNML